MMGRKQYGTRQAAQDGPLMLDEIRAVDFSLIETALYLDAYPESSEALSYYRTLRDKRKQLWQQYETQVGPLTILGNEEARWQWTEDPWPWEYEGN